MSPQTAAELTGMMRRVVEEGTGQAANIGDLSVAGKTGTAETGVAGLNNAWFIAFAPAEDPQHRGGGRHRADARVRRHHRRAHCRERD